MYLYLQIVLILTGSYVDQTRGDLSRVRKLYLPPELYV
jgi:hypothetical protein